MEQSREPRSKCECDLQRLVCRLEAMKRGVCLGPVQTIVGLQSFGSNVGSLGNAALSGVDALADKVLAQGPGSEVQGRVRCRCLPGSLIRTSRAGRRERCAILEVDLANASGGTEPRLHLCCFQRPPALWSAGRSQDPPLERDRSHCPRGVRRGCCLISVPSSCESTSRPCSMRLLASAGSVRGLVRCTAASGSGGSRRRTGEASGWRSAACSVARDSVLKNPPHVEMCQSHWGVASDVCLTPTYRCCDLLNSTCCRISSMQRRRP